MDRSPRTMPGRCLLFVLCVAVAALASATRVQAQTQCFRLSPPCQDDPPLVRITPGDQTVTQATLSVRIDYSDQQHLDASSPRIWLNGTETGTFQTSIGTTTGQSTGQVALAVGTNRVRARICDLPTPGGGGTCTESTTTYVYTPPPAPAARVAPVVSLAPHHSGFRDVTQGAANVSYTTPAYVSLDQARAVTLLFSSAQLTPRGFVQVDAIDHSVEAPARMSIRLYNDVGDAVTFTDGSQEIFYQSGSGTTRLAAHFHEPRHPGASLAYGYQVVVRSWWADGTSLESPRQALRVLKIDRAHSTFGRGWSVVGVQRLVNQGDGVLVTQGDGTGVWFVGSTSHGYTAPDGDFTRIRWDTPLQGWVREYPDGMVVRFRSDGLMIDRTDRFGNATAFAYDGAGRLSTITDPIGKVTTFGYNTEGVMDWIEDPMGRRVVTAAAAGYLWHIVDPDGSSALRLSIYSDVLQTSWAKGADASQPGTGTDYAYDRFGKLSAVTAPLVGTSDAGTVRPVTRFTSLEAAAMPAAGAGTAAAPGARLLPENVRQSTTDPRGHTTTVAVDRFGNVRRMETATGDTTIVDRNFSGQPTQVFSQDWLTPVADYQWRGPNLVYARDRVAGTEVSIAYDTVVNLPKQVSVGGASVTYRYGTRGELLSARSGTDSTTFGYDTRGRMLWRRDPQGHRVDASYETAGARNLAWQRDVDASGSSRTVFYGYDAYGRPEAVTTPAGVTRTYRDLLNRDTSVVQPGGVTTRFVFQGPFLRQVVDAAGKSYTSNRNALGWVESEVDSNGRAISYGYDRSGNRTRTTDRRGRVVELTFDPAGRVLTRTADNALTTYGYGTPRAPWIGTHNAESADTVHFDRAGRPVRQVAVMGGQRFVLNSHFLKEGPRDTLRIEGPWSRTIAYRYNNRLQLDTLVDLAGGRTRLGYNTDGLLASITLPGGGQSTVTYTPTHQPSLYTLAAGGLRLQYGYDALDRMNSRAMVYQDSVRRFGYDALGRLTGASEYTIDEKQVCTDPRRPDSCSLQSVERLVRSRAFGYDAVGNRTDSGAALEPTSNRYAAFDGFTFQYDLEGSLTNKFRANTSSQGNEWNSLGQLSVVHHSTRGSAWYGYNGFGQRVRKTHSDGSVTRFLYEGDDLLMEVDGAGNLLREYTYYPGIDQPHSVRVWANGGAGTVLYYALEQPGHVLGLISGSNGMVNRYRYAPFGQVESGTESLPQPLRYMAREWDDQTQLYYVRNRWYDPQVARFISEDPIGLAGGVNPYVYAENSPLNHTDPLGLCVGEKYNVNKTICKIGGLIVNGGQDDYSSGWASSPSNRGSNWGRGGGTSSSGGGGNGRHRDYVLEMITDFGLDAAQCTSEQFGLDGLIQDASTTLRLMSYTGAFPVHKHWVPVPIFPGASRYTNGLNVTLHSMFGSARMATKSTLFGTRSMTTMIGRANVVTGLGFAAYDVTSILSCALSD